MVEPDADKTSPDLLLVPRRARAMDVLTMTTKYGERRDEFHATHVLDNVSDLRQRHALFDVTLKAGSLQVPCHRIILAGASGYFRALFTCEMLERRLAEVPIVGVRPAVLQLVIDFVYTGRATGLTPDNVRAVAEAASFLQVLRLLHVCEDFMAETLTPATAIGAHEFATRLTLGRLAARARFVLCDGFATVARQAEFAAMTEAALQRYLADDDLSVESEDEVWEAARRWLLHDFTARMPAAARVLAHVRFPFCTRELFARSVRDSVLMSAPGCARFVDEYDAFRAGAASEVGGRRGVARDGMKDVLVLGGMTAQGPNYDMWRYRLRTGAHDDDDDDSSDGSYEKSGVVAGLPARSRFFGACVCRKKLYVFGGQPAGGDIVADTWVYNADTRDWRRVGDMTRARMMHSAVECGGFVYAAGGHSTEEAEVEVEEGGEDDDAVAEEVLRAPLVGVILDSAERYDPDEEKWHRLANMPVAVRRGAMAAVDGRVYVVGGNTGILASDACDAVQCYDPSAEQWTRLAALPRPVLCPTAVVTGDGRLYLHDGTEGRMSEYDARGDVWRSSGEVCADDHFEGCGVWWRGRILMIGGKSKNILGRSSSADAYDAKAGTWQKVDTVLHSPLSSFVVALLRVR